MDAMKPQEIKNGMMQFEYKSLDESYREIRSGGRMVAEMTGMQFPIRKADCLAITTAVNNTYGKNIDPEKVSEMFEMLERLKGAEYIGFDDAEEIAKLVQSAKLKP